MRCQGQATAGASASSELQLFRPGRYTLDGHAPDLRQLPSSNGRRGAAISLCEALAATGADAAVFQFAGFDCRECMDHAASIRRQREALTAAQQQRVAHVVVFTDFHEDVTRSDLTGFLAEHAPEALAVTDEARLWKAFSADPRAPDRNTVLVMNRNMEAVVRNTPGSYGQIVAAGLDLAARLTEAP